MLLWHQRKHYGSVNTLSERTEIVLTKKNPKHHKTKEDEILQNAVSVLA